MMCYKTNFKNEKNSKKVETNHKNGTSYECEKARKEKRKQRKWGKRLKKRIMIVLCKGMIYLLLLLLSFTKMHSL